MKKFPVVALDGIEEFPSMQTEPTIYELTPYKSIKLSVLAHIRKDSPILVVLFNGAAGEDYKGNPSFMRWSWANRAGFSFLSIDDPIVSSMGKTNLAWYVGTKDFDLQDYLNGLLIQILGQRELKPNKVVFYGSSGGGFASAMAAFRLRGSVAIVNNPQTNIFSYSKRFCDLFIECFGASEDDIKKNHYHRFSLSHAMEYYNYLPRILYRQNTQDVIHVKNHLLKFQSSYLNFIAGVGDYSNQLTVEYFNDKDGHSVFSSESDFVREVRAAVHNIPSTVSDVRSPLTGSIELGSGIDWLNLNIPNATKAIRIKAKAKLIVADENCQPLLIAIDTIETDSAKLKVVGLSYSQGLKCAFKYITLDAKGEFEVSLSTAVAISKVGFRIWKGASEVLLTNLVVEFE